MKFTNKITFFLSLLSASFCIEAKQVEFILNQTTRQEWAVHHPFVDNGSKDCPCCPRKKKKKDENQGQSLHYSKMSIENQGTVSVESCLPFIDKQPIYSLSALANFLYEEDRPLQALYRLWTDSVTILEDGTSCDDPLYVLNFKGYCSKQEYLRNFVNLCGSLGIDARPASIQGTELYDFCYQGDQWEFLDPVSKQLYLALDNETLVSSEEIMDDPFLAIRTKHNRLSDQVDFKESWKQLARFEIVNSYLDPAMVSTGLQIDEGKNFGFDLLPQEKLVYHRKNAGQNKVEQILNVASRLQEGYICYQSPFPIKEIYNHTNSTIILTDLQQTLQPGENLCIPDPAIFSLQISVGDSSISGTIHVSTICSDRFFPSLKGGKNNFDLGTATNLSSIAVIYDLDDTFEQTTINPLKISNEESTFDHVSPFFKLESVQTSKKIEKIWWQISSTSDFKLIPSNFEQVESLKGIITVPSITETFFNANDEYFFRVKACVDGVWSDWSDSFAFIVKKPEPVSRVEFDKIDDNCYEISWRKFAEDEGVEYLIFGSNSLDFIPSVYSDVQINAIVDDIVVETESNNNLKFITQDSKVFVDGSLAYYRIIARHRGQLSVPSKIIHVYDTDLVQTRNVLQVIKTEDKHSIIKRVDLPSFSSTSDLSEMIPITRSINWENRIFEIPSQVFRNISTMKNAAPFTKSNYVSEEIWQHVKPYLMPENHPLRPKLDRMFSEFRVTKDPSSFKKAGFKNYQPRRASHILASPHPRLIGYYIKAFPDTEIRYYDDWKRLSHRVEGANNIRAYLVSKGYHHKFKVPHKWLYPLPAEPAAPVGPRYIRKNFILVAEDMRIVDPEKNNKMYKKHMTKQLIEAIYNTIMDLGLYDTVYAFNLPFAKDGKLAFIDTEYHHKWPVPTYKFEKYFSKSMKEYWLRLCKEGERQGRNRER